MNIEINQVYHGDSEVILKYFPDDFIDCVITSPPYNLSMSYDCYSDNLPQEEYNNKMKNIFKELYRVMKDDGRLIINTGFAMMDVKTKVVKYVFLDTINTLREIGFKEMDFIIWAKGDEEFIKNKNYSTRWGSWLSASRPVIRSDSEGIFIFTKKHYKKQTKGTSTIESEEFKTYTKNIWYIRNYNHPEHKYIYPEELITRLIKLYTYKEDVVLDPFMGIGTTISACITNGRNYIGIELCEKYYNICLNNIKNLKSRLF